MGKRAHICSMYVGCLAIFPAVITVFPAGDQLVGGEVGFWRFLLVMWSVLILCTPAIIELRRRPSPVAIYLACIGVGAVAATIGLRALVDILRESAEPGWVVIPWILSIGASFALIIILTQFNEKHLAGESAGDDEGAGTTSPGKAQS